MVTAIDTFQNVNVAILYTEYGQPHKDGALG